MHFVTLLDRLPEKQVHANAHLIALAPELAAETITLRAQAAKDKARIERLEAALRGLANSLEIQPGPRGVLDLVPRSLAIARAALEAEQ